MEYNHYFSLSLLLFYFSTVLIFKIKTKLNETPVSKESDSRFSRGFISYPNKIEIGAAGKEYVFVLVL